MNNRPVRNLFIFGSLFFMTALIALTVDTFKKLPSRAPEITKEVNAGKMVWHKYDCIGCHTILGNGSYFAPDMTKIAVRKPREYLKRFIMDPKSVNANAVMPKFGITPEEADNLLAFLEWIAGVDTNGWPPSPMLAEAAVVGGREPTRGQALYRSLGCSACHMINGIGGTTGPDLTRVGARRERAWLFGHFKDPRAYVPDSAMPAVDAPDEEIEQLTDYMLTLK